MKVVLIEVGQFNSWYVSNFNLSNYNLPTFRCFQPYFPTKHTYEPSKLFMDEDQRIVQFKMTRCNVLENVIRISTYRSVINPSLKS